LREQAKGDAPGDPAVPELERPRGQT
jgi:hypothetical protein